MKEKLFSQHCAILRVRPRLEAAPERRRLLPGAAARAVLWTLNGEAIEHFVLGLRFKVYCVVRCRGGLGRHIELLAR